MPIYEGAEADIWIYDIARGTRTRFTFGGGRNARSISDGPCWTPDGKYIVYASILYSSPDDKEGTQHLFWKPADGSREAVQLTRDAYPISFSPDGSVLALHSFSPETRLDLSLLHLEGIDPYKATPPKPEVWLRTPFIEIFPRFSPDGRWIAYISDESGRFEVYVRPYRGPGGKVQISANGGLESLWNSNGRELFYFTGTGWYAVDVTLAPEFRAGKPRLLFEGPFLDIPGFSYDMTPDGQRFLVHENTEQFKAWTTLTVITNFFDQLPRRVPSAKK